MESYLPNNFCFPKRPSKNLSGTKIEILTNYFQFIHRQQIKNENSNSGFYKYAIIINPEIPGDSIKLRNKIWRESRNEVSKILSHTIYNNNTCYSKILTYEEISVNISLEEINYNVLVKWANKVDDKSEEALGLYKKFFHGLVRKLDLISIRKNYFHRGKAQKVEDIEVWQGFSPTINLTSVGILLNIGIIHKVLRPETALDILKKIRDNTRNNRTLLTEEVAKIFNGTVVLTRYNNDKTYIVDHVSFDKTPNDKFTSDKDGKEMITYFDYYKEKYQRIIKDLNQPLFAVKDKRKNEFIYLVPELCYMTGITDEMRNNFNVMKKLAEISSGNPEEKLKECRELIKQFGFNDKCKKDIENWNLEISDDPIKISGTRLSAGDYILKSTQFSTEAPDVDRKIQTEMYNQPKLHTWMVIYMTYKFKIFEI